MPHRWPPRSLSRVSRDIPPWFFADRRPPVAPGEDHSGQHIVHGQPPGGLGPRGSQGDCHHPCGASELDGGGVPEGRGQSVRLHQHDEEGTFSQPFKEKCISEVMGIGSIIVFHVSGIHSMGCVKTTLPKIYLLNLSISRNRIRIGAGGSVRESFCLSNSKTPTGRKSFWRIPTSAYPSE